MCVLLSLKSNGLTYRSRIFQPKTPSTDFLFSVAQKIYKKNATERKSVCTLEFNANRLTYRLRLFQAKTPSTDFLWHKKMI